MNAAQFNAVALVEAAYEDCATICDHLAAGAVAGLASAGPREAMMAEITLKGVADAIRNKKKFIRDTLSLGLADLETAQ